MQTFFKSSAFLVLTDARLNETDWPLFKIDGWVFRNRWLPISNNIYCSGWYYRPELSPTLNEWAPVLVSWKIFVQISYGTRWLTQKFSKGSKKNVFRLGSSDTYSRKQIYNRIASLTTKMLWINAQGIYYYFFIFRGGVYSRGESKRERCFLNFDNFVFFIKNYFLITRHIWLDNV